MKINSIQYMIRISVVVFFSVFISCQSSVSKENIKYYKCDYTLKNSLSVILSSGTGNDEPTEYWAVNTSEIKDYSNYNLKNIDIELLIKNGKKHLSKRFSPIELKFSEISIQSINQTDSKPPIYIGILSFEYGENVFQMTPILLDGTIVLSNNE